MNLPISFFSKNVSDIPVSTVPVRASNGVLKRFSCRYSEDENNVLLWATIYGYILTPRQAKKTFSARSVHFSHAECDSLPSLFRSMLREAIHLCECSPKNGGVFEKTRCVFHKTSPLYFISPPLSITLAPWRTLAPARALLSCYLHPPSAARRALRAFKNKGLPHKVQHERREEPQMPTSKRVCPQINTKTPPF